jgi:hypothetical protein
MLDGATSLAARDPHVARLRPTGEALRAGRPIVGAPFAYDQFSLCASVERLGVGVRMPVTGRTRADFATVLGRILADDTLARRQARRTAIRLRARRRRAGRRRDRARQRRCDTAYGSTGMSRTLTCPATVRLVPSLTLRSCFRQVYERLRAAQGDGG